MQMNRIILFIGLILIKGCAPTSKDVPNSLSTINNSLKPNNNPLVIGFNKDFDFENIKPGHIKEGTDYVLSQANKIKSKIINQDNKTYENTLIPIDDIYNVIESVWSPGYLMGSVHTNEKIRNEGLESSKTIQNYMTDLSLDEDLYNAVLEYSKSDEAKSLKGLRKKFLDDMLLGYKRIGFMLPKEQREKVKSVLNTLTNLGLEFDKNIRSAQDTLFLEEKDLEGMPDNYIKERLHSSGKYAIDMSYPSYIPFIKFKSQQLSRLI